MMEAFFQATKKLTGGNNFSKRRVEKTEELRPSSKKEENIIKVFFDPGHYTVMENVGQFAVSVTREGDLNHSICVDFKTEDGTANAGSDYEPVEGTLIFRSGEAYKQVSGWNGKMWNTIFKMICQYFVCHHV